MTQTTVRPNPNPWYRIFWPWTNNIDSDDELTHEDILHNVDYVDELTQELTQEDTLPTIEKLLWFTNVVGLFNNIFGFIVVVLAVVSICMILPLCLAWTIDIEILMQMGKLSALFTLVTPLLVMSVSPVFLIFCGSSTMKSTREFLIHISDHISIGEAAKRLSKKFLIMMIVLMVFRAVLEYNRIRKGEFEPWKKVTYAACLWLSGVYSTLVFLVANFVFWLACEIQKLHYDDLKQMWVDSEVDVDTSLFINKHRNICSRVVLINNRFHRFLMAQHIFLPIALLTTLFQINAEKRLMGTNTLETDTFLLLGGDYLYYTFVQAMGSCVWMFAAIEMCNGEQSVASQVANYNIDRAIRSRHEDPNAMPDPIASVLAQYLATNQGEIKIFLWTVNHHFMEAVCVFNVGIATFVLGNVLYV